MMLIDKYIIKSILFSFALVLLVVVGLDTLFVFLDEINSINKDYQLLQVLLYSLMTLPYRSIEFLPIIILLAVLIGLGGLSNSSELIVMRAAGVSPFRILLPLLQISFLLLLVALLSSEFITPKVQLYAESYKSIKSSGLKSDSFWKGYWYREDDEYILINAIEPNGVLHGVTRFKVDDAGKMVSTGNYSRAVYQGDHWVIQDGVLTEFDKGMIKQKQISSGTWKNKLTPDVLSILLIESEYWSISNLFRYAQSLPEQGISGQEYALSFWEKVMMPLSALAMVLIASFFIFGSNRSIAIGSRVVVGIMIGLGFTQLQKFSINLALVFHVNAIFAVMIPILVSWLVAAFLIYRAR